MARVSYSQYSMWTSCPQQYKFNYIDKLGVSSSNIHTIFGTAVHETLQHYLTIFYNISKKKANEIDLNELLQERLRDNFVKEHEGLPDGTYLCTKEQLNEFYSDGVECMNWFKKKVGDFFDKKGWELVGIEKPINLKVKENVNVIGFLDIVLKDVASNRIKIIDLKTSTSGWNKYQKSDASKLNQLRLYKYFYSIQYNHPIENIDVEFQIIKRKINEDFEYPIPRISKLVPSNGTNTVNKAAKEFMNFVDNVFNEDGSYNLESDYSPNPGESNKNCRFCEFKEICPNFQK